MLDFSLKIGGQAGQGLQTIGDVISKALLRSGYHVFTVQDYLSRIRGGHNFTQVRVKDQPVASIRPVVNLLVALDRATIDEHAGELLPGGAVIHDEAFQVPASAAGHLLPLPLKGLAKEAGDPVTENTVAAGAIWGLVSGDLDLLLGLLAETFFPKGARLVEVNHKAARLGHDFARERCPQCLPVRLARLQAPARLLITGNEALGLGALAAGCRWMSAYPMTPSTGIMNYLAAKSAEYGLVVEQAEDEIAAINMAVGASFGGLRALTATSGGGFALMNEALSLSAMTETPIVVVLGQRPGPATGLPTRTGQEELLYALHAGAGEFTRVILAPGTAEEAFHLMTKAFNLADRYQIPVIILSDQHLADSYFTVEDLDFLGRVKIDRGDLWDPTGQPPYSYRRHVWTENGVSPRLFPGTPNQLVVTDSDEHTEDGHITEDLQTRVKMVDKRLRLKQRALRGEIAPPRLYGPITADVTLLGWGSTQGAITEAVDALRRRQVAANAIIFTEIWPMPVESAKAVLANRRRLVAVENNAGGQLSRLLHDSTGIESDHQILKYDGRPFTADYILAGLSGLV
ncbi:MAG: 2-oxoacid:acceptor oxidoreductase subunit alpha [Pseudomonadota bacterium]